MKLCAQLYSIRDHCQTAKDLGDAFRRLKEIGYRGVQLSGIGAAVTPAEIAACIKEYDLPAVGTHSPFDRIVGDTDALIAEHRLYGCTEIGIGGITGEQRKDLATVRQTLAQLRTAAQKIRAAGMSFAFHNHHREFDDLGGVTMFDLMVDECPEFNFVLDVYWATYAGVDPLALINRVGKRIYNIHFKDMATAPKGKICACGRGIIDFKPIYDACLAQGVTNVLVEEDNAAEYGDSIDEMAISYRHLAPLFKS